MEPNEEQQFLDDILPKSDIGNDPFQENVSQEPPAQEPSVVDEEHAKNRRERRLQAKLEAERASAIQLAAKLEAITEAQKVRSDTTENDYLKSVERIYGTETPEGREATELLKLALKGVGEEAKRSAVEEFKAEQARMNEEVRRRESELDMMLEEIEDEHNVDLTSSASEATRKGFLKLLEKMSPKDKEGNIIQFADHTAVWEMYASQSSKKENPARQLSSRSMTPTGAPRNEQLKNDVEARQLSELGII